MGSKEIDPFHPRFTIVDSMELIPSGTELDRVGIASGWVYGTLTESCVNERVFSDGVQTDFWILCSGTFDATLREGDSGGPVFKVLNLPSGEVELAGIAWSGGFRRTRFSKYAHISYDLTDRDRSFACYQFNCWPRLTVSAP
jgi:hypothetical protein